MIFEATGPYNAIGKIAMSQVNAALAAGWHVSVVAKRLCESLQGRVEWLKLYVPPRGFALQWLTARRFIRHALGDVSRFDVIHGHQPQIADLCDVFQCHFLTRVAYERDCLEDGTGLRRLFNRLQKLAVLFAEDRHYSNWNPRTKMVFVSGLLQDEFARLYRKPSQSLVVENAGPPTNPVTTEERNWAREALLGDVGERTVVGFLGGTTQRKGYTILRNAILEDERLHWLIGGAGTQDMHDPAFGQRITAVGMVQNTDKFYAACDVVAVPSIFDPCPYVVLEAASRGLPVIVTNGVGNAASLVSRGAGKLWSTDANFGDCIANIIEHREAYSSAAIRWSQDSTLHAYCDRFLQMYHEVVLAKRNR